MDWYKLRTTATGKRFSHLVRLWCEGVREKKTFHERPFRSAKLELVMAISKMALPIVLDLFYHFIVACTFTRMLWRTSIRKAFPLLTLCTQNFSRSNFLAQMRSKRYWKRPEASFPASSNCWKSFRKRKTSVANKPKNAPSQKKFFSGSRRFTAGNFGAALPAE